MTKTIPQVTKELNELERHVKLILVAYQDWIDSGGIPRLPDGTMPITSREQLEDIINDGHQAGELTKIDAAHLRSALHAKEWDIALGVEIMDEMDDIKANNEKYKKSVRRDIQIAYQDKRIDQAEFEILQDRLNEAKATSDFVEIYEAYRNVVEGWKFDFNF